MIQKISKFGFSVSVRMGYSDKQVDVFIDDLINFIEKQGFLCGGGYSDKHLHFFIYRKKGSATDIDRQNVRLWLKKHPQLKTIRIAKLVDVNV